MADETPANESPEETSGSVDVPESQDSGEGLDLDAYKAKIHKANQEAKSLRQRLREAEGKLARFEEPAKEEEPAESGSDGGDKDSSAEKLHAAEQRAVEAEQRAVEAEQRLVRLEVAQEKGLTAAQAKRLLGATREELESDADELLETFKVGTSGRTTRTHRPTESLKAGRSPDEQPEETDPRKLASKVRRW